jgi:hypothetical protein
MTQEEVDTIFSTVSDFYLKDAQRIQAVIKSAFNIDVSLSNVVMFWKDHSDAWCAGWLGIECDEEIIEAFEEFYNSKTNGYGYSLKLDRM